ncbi:MAG: fluoroacetyl-CoA thioesterase [Nocardioidaceae bacterium]|nr:fluoroacetyl-CoA thioesterase [Nocardioidaceae bacterium]
MDEADRNATLSFVVGDEDTAAAVGSGDLPVLSTPRVLAWAEAATCAAIREELKEDQTSVGTRVNLEHLVASAVGEPVTVTATTKHRDGRLVRFEVAATDSAGTLVAHGEVTRVVVQRERFMDRLAR